ncbi:heterotrimeric GTP-binding alpha subunit [Agrocybe pediades]|nr:heterotrimeric GTP-binding alpha subunit [Agrocybe pediades]
MFKNPKNVIYEPAKNPYDVGRWSGVRGDESDEEVERKLQVSRENDERSRRIDLQLLEDKRVWDRQAKAVKILLLGQSESGKVCSKLYYFQLAFAPKHFENERLIWKTIIQLNIIGSIKTILDALKEEYEPNGFPVTPTDPSSNSPLRMLRRIRLGLSPLFFIESNLLKVLAPECADSRVMTIRAGTGWKSLLKSKAAQPFLSSANKENGLGHKKSYNTLNQENDPTSVLVGQRDDIIALWENPETQEVLKRRRPNLRKKPGFFLDDMARILRADYVPTDQDIIRARLKTVGIEQHFFTAEKGHTDFCITDVGGARNQRAHWAPYFDSVHAIVFLAPLAFDQVLEEDPSVNRLEDSILLWRDICGNKLLAHANIILFLNKKDVLAATLKAGVRIKSWVPTYGDLPNDVSSVTKYFKEKFRAYHKKFSPEPRPFLCHETSALDIKSMSVLLIGVRESILRQYLREGDML